MQYNFNWNIIRECKQAHRKQVYPKQADRKQYQHEYYLKVTKPKRHKAR